MTLVACVTCCCRLQSIGGGALLLKPGRASGRGAPHLPADALTLHLSPDLQSVDTTGFGFLDFELSPERQQELFKRGMKAAVDFLEG